MPRVLLIDDHALMLELEETFLERSEFTVMSATNAVEGINLGQESPPDVVVIDHEMPNMTGGHAIKKMRKLPAFADTKFLLASAMGIAEESSPADLTIRKPFSPNDFLAAIRSLLDVPTRRAARVEVRATVSWERCDGNGSGEGETRDMSTTGMLLTGDGLPPVGAHINAKIELATGPLDTVGGVVRTTIVDAEGNPAVGVDFETLSPAQRAIVEARLGIDPKDVGDG